MQVVVNIKPRSVTHALRCIVLAILEDKRKNLQLLGHGRQRKEMPAEGSPAMELEDNEERRL
jgi:hypothetical protein